MNIFDIIIVGAGPAGSTAALFAGEAGLRTLLIDKATFPRDKVCGDAISGKSLGILRELNLIDKIEKIPQIRANGVVFSSPRGHELPVRFRSSTPGHSLHGYVCKRIDFDHFLFKQAKSKVDQCIEKFRTTIVKRREDGLTAIRGRIAGEKKEREFLGKMIIAADGYKSLIAQKIGHYQYDTRHTLVALRAYFQNVEGMSDFIEIHFVKESLPGYFWIFPLGDGLANVGVGMRHLDIKKRNIDLFQVLESIMDSQKFRQRFFKAELLGKIKGWNLPTGSIFRSNHSDGLILVGDAAGLIDPFTGEGIGNAMTSAQIAIQVAAAAIREGDTSKARLTEFDRLLKKAIGKELHLSYQLQKIGRSFPFLLDFVIWKATRSQQVAEWISSMIADENSKQDLANPITYVKLLWA